jgi:hypothetical protein
MNLKSDTPMQELEGRCSLPLRTERVHCVLVLQQRS